MGYTGKKPTNVVDVSETQSLTVDGDLTVDTTTLKVDSANNRVGIGKTPTTALDILNGSTSTGTLKVQNASGSSASTAIFEAVNGGGTSRLIILNDGKVGIGTSSPSSILHLSASDDPIITLTDTGASASADITGSNGNLRLNSQTATIFDMADSEIARFDSSGNLEIATTTSPSTSVFGIHLNATGLFKNSRNTGASGASAQIFGNAGECRIMGDGDILNTNDSYGAISDETLKQDIVDAASQWADIKALKVRKFRFKDNPTGTLQIGVIAQELEASGMNGLVKQIDLNQDEDSEETIKAVKYSVLHMKAVKALQEAMERIEALETKVAALEG